jgi:hypothetical protein
LAKIWQIHVVGSQNWLWSYSSFGNYTAQFMWLPREAVSKQKLTERSNKADEIRKPTQNDFTCFEV